MPRDCLRIIKSKSKVCNSRNKPVVAQVSLSSSTPGISPDIAELKDMVKALLLDKKSQALAPVKAVEESFVTCGGAHSYQNCPATDGNVYRDNIQEYFMNSNTASTSGSGSLPSNTITNLKVDLKGITTRSGVAYQGPTIPTTSSSPPNVVEREPEVTKDMVPPTNNGNNKDVQPPVVQVQPHVLNSKPVVAPVSAPMPNLKPSIPLTDALILMPKFASALKSLIGNKGKLSEMARTPLKEHYSAVILNKLPEKLGDPVKFLIPCDFPGMDECLALADLGASINLMPLFVWKKLSLLELTPNCMTLELADRSITQPIGISEDVDVKVGKYSSNYDDMTTNQIDVIENGLLRIFLRSSRVFPMWIVSGNPTSYYDPIVSTSSPNLTPFGDSDFLLEEVNAFLALKDDPTSAEVDDSYYDPEGDILLLESFVNDDPSFPPPTQGNYLPEIRKELKVCEAKTDKSSIDEPPEVELKDLPPHLKYAFLEDDDKLPVIIAKDLSVEEKAAFIKVLKSQKRAIACKLSDIKGINLEFYTHKILMEEDYKPAIQHQRRVNPKIHDVIKKEVEKLLDAGLIYPISDSPWVTFKLPSTLMIKKRQHSRVLTERSPTVACLLAYAMHRARSKDKMLQRCEDTNLCLNWEKSHFMVKEGIVLGHKISKNGIEVSGEIAPVGSAPSRVQIQTPILIAPDWDLPFKLMCDASDFAIGEANLGKRIFKKRSKKKAKNKQIQAREGKDSSQVESESHPHEDITSLGLKTAKPKVCMRTRSQARRLLTTTSINNKFLRILLNFPIVTWLISVLWQKLLRAPTEGYEDAIVVPEIEAAYFEIHMLIICRPKPVEFRKPFLERKSLDDVHGEEMTLRHDDKSVTFKVGDTKNFSYNAMESVNKVDFIDIACEEYSQEILGFSELSANGNSTPYFEPIVDTTSPTLTPFEGRIDDAECDLEKDILLLEAILNSEPLSPLPNHANYFPEVRKELKICEAKPDGTSIDEPPDELKAYLPTRICIFRG
ncbi:reverse transcriptase domain-containing protein [Tanacetum coccineum]